MIAGLLYNIHQAEIVKASLNYCRITCEILIIKVFFISRDKTGVEDCIMSRVFLYRFRMAQEGYFY